MRPSVYQSIVALKKIQQENEIAFARVMSGGRVKLQKKKDRETNDRLVELKMMLLMDDIDVFDYLDECGIQ